MDIKQFHNMNTDIAKAFFYRDGKLPGTLIAAIPDDKLLFCQRGFEDGKEKIKTFDLYAIILKMKNAPIYSFVSEMWFSKEEDLNGPFRLPSQRSDRKEGIMIATRNKEGNSLFATFEIERSENDVNLIESEFNDGKHEDQMNLYKRVKPLINKSELKKLQKSFDAIEKSSWYYEMEYKLKQCNKPL